MLKIQKLNKGTKLWFHTALKIRMELLTGTVLVSKLLLAGTVPVNKLLLTGTLSNVRRCWLAMPLGAGVPYYRTFLDMLVPYVTIAYIVLYECNEKFHFLTKIPLRMCNSSGQKGSLQSYWYGLSLQRRCK